jgi:hypothetical protein
MKIPLGLCQCGCGGKTKIAIRTDRNYGRTKGQPFRYLLGHRSKKKNALSRNPYYAIFMGAKSRCNNPNSTSWKDYGGRGIKFLFTSFEQFFAELGPKPSPKHSLDRIDNEGNYEPGNVKWSTRAEQHANKRRKRGKGYSWNKTDKRWKASICVDNEHIHLGLFLTEEEAKQAYEKALQSALQERGL